MKGWTTGDCVVWVGMEDRTGLAPLAGKGDFANCANVPICGSVISEFNSRRKPAIALPQWAGALRKIAGKLGAEHR